MPFRRRIEPEVTLDKCEVIAKTEKAVLIEWKAHGEVFNAWVPRSVCTDGQTLQPGDTDIIVQEWFAEKEGLPYREE